MWFFPSLTEIWDMPPAPPLGLPLGPLAPFNGPDLNLALCHGSPWLSTAIAGQWDELFQAVGVIWPLRSAAVAFDFGKVTPRL